MKIRIPITIAILLFIAIGATSQTRSMKQDPALNNLRLPEGTKTVPDGTLGKVTKIGTGPKKVLLIPGLGFGAEIWDEFADRFKTRFTMYAVTLPGFGDTPPLAMPPESTNYAETTWTRSAVSAIGKLIEQERLDRVTIIAHWALATQISLRLAIDHPDRIGSVILIGGPLKVNFENSPTDMLKWTAEERAKFIEGLGARWFKTVTRDTWDDNNFMTYDYAVNPRRALFLWRAAQKPLLQVWIRYLLEFYSIDPFPDLKDLKVPTLVVQPAFDDPGYYVELNRNYMRDFCIDSWSGAKGQSDKLEFVTISGSRLFVMYDRPDDLDKTITGFFDRIAGRTLRR